MVLCHPDTDHKRAFVHGATMSAVSVMAFAIFGYIFYSLYDSAVNDLEHFNNWNRTMHELDFDCPQHWALHMKCCTCKTIVYGHCCARGTH